MFVVVCGNPIEGFVFYGPFACAEEAASWGENNITPQRAYNEFWVAPLYANELNATVAAILRERRN